MFAAPGTPIGQRLSRAAAEQVARSWWVLLVNGAVFIFQGIAIALTSGIDARVRPTTAWAGS